MEVTEHTDSVLVLVHSPALRESVERQLARFQATPIHATGIGCRVFVENVLRSELLITDVEADVLEKITVGDTPLARSGIPTILLGQDPSRDLGPTPEGWKVTTAQHLDRTIASVFANGARNSQRVTANSGHTQLPKSHIRQALARRDELVSSIAHDLRTPLTAIQEFSHLMTEELAGELNDTQRRYVRIIEKRCHEAARMVDDLLDAARIQSGRLHLHRVALPLTEVLDDIAESLEPTMHDSGIKLRRQIPEGMPDVFADRDLLVRILTNLVSNALKHSERDAEVVVQMQLSSMEMARIAVIDSGPGISARDMQRIFRRFERGANPGPGGVGLGLSIVRQLVRLHGGRVSVESTKGKGSKFQISLPVYLPPALIRNRLRQLSGDGQFMGSIFELTISDATRFSPIHRLLSCNVSPKDLVLADRERMKILVISKISQPQQWIDQLMNQVESLGAIAPGVRRLSVQEARRWGQPGTRPGDTSSIKLVS